MMFDITVQRKRSRNWKGRRWRKTVGIKLKMGSNVVGTNPNMIIRTAIQYAIDIFLSEEKRKA